MSNIGGHSYRYGVFLSYAHVDRRWARRLAKLLETWKVPGRLVGTEGQFGPVPGKLGPVFRDRDELSASSELGATISGALEESAAMVVLCSPAAARSRWVNEEVRAFKALGRADRIFALIIDGDPAAGDGLAQCFPPALRFEVDEQGRLCNAPAEPVAADARKQGDGPRRAQTRLLAGLLGVGYDALYRREQHRRNRRLAAIAAAVAIGVAVTSSMSLSTWKARDDAQRRRAQSEALIDYLVAERHPELQGIDRSDAPVTLDDGTVIAAGPVASATPDELIKREAQSLLEQGDTWIRESRLDEALQAMRLAHAREIELVRRHPGDPDQKFDLGQAAFWVGNVYYLRKDMDSAERWFSAYRDTSRVLAALNPERLEWVREQAYGDHNIAVWRIQRGDADSAAAIFANVVDILRGLQERGFEPDTIARDIADAISWQGSTAERLGDLAAAEAYFRESEAVYSEIVTSLKTPEAVHYEHGNVLIHLSRLLSVTGRPDKAEQAAARAADIQTWGWGIDPDKARWMRSYYIARRAQASIAADQGNLAEAREFIAELKAADPSCCGMESPADTVPARLVTARLALFEGDPGRALEEAQAAVQAAEAELPASDDEAAADGAAAQLARSLLLRGEAALALGEDDASTADFERAYFVLEPHTAGSRYWAVLDPFARAALLTGRPGEAAPAMRVLEDAGYVPPQPWPEAR